MKLRYKKLTAALLTAVMAASLLAGCQGKKEDAKQETKTQTEAKQPETVNITALKGPTAMGMVSMMNDTDNKKEGMENYHFTIAASVDEVVPAVAQGKTDIAAVPANMASVLYQKTKGQVQALAINTLGVIYIVENGTAIQSAADLKGKTIYASGKGATPEYALNYILEKNGIDPAADVTIEWKNEHTECVAALAQNPEGIAMLPQPFVTTAQMENPDLRIALDLTEEWEKLQKDEKSPSALLTGALIVRKDFAEKYPGAVSDFMERYSASVEFVNANTKEAAELVGKYDIVPAPVAEKALPACNIVCIQGKEMKEKLSGYLTVLHGQNPESIGGKLPDDDFYYISK